MKKFIFTILGLLVFVAGFGETVSQKHALELAQMFFNEAAGRVTAPPKLIFNGRKFTINRLFTPFYIYNSALGGFVIISAENKAYPILGFSLKESFDPERINEAETALFKSYAQEIELIRYDTQPIDSTIWAWQHFPEYVNNILKSKYMATDPVISLDESLRILENAVEKDDAVYSDLYTPEQWRDMINEELNFKESVPLGLVSDYKLYPAVIYGRQGDYFRIEMTSRNSWLMRLNATEAIASNMVSAVVSPVELPNEDEIERPFEEHDVFLAEVNEIEGLRMEKSSIDFPSFHGAPLVRANGGGHFQIQLPEEVVIAKVFNIAGSPIMTRTYSNTDSAHIDLSAEPFGFYFVMLQGVSGTPYGFKLYR